MQIKTCQKCGAKLWHDIPEGVCPCCLIQAGIDLSLDALPNVSATAGEVSAHAPVREPGLPILEARPDRPIAPLAGRRFGDYEVIEEIARGGMGVVYKARQLSLNRLVAVKMIQAGLLASPEMVFRFGAEAEAAGSLRHPNIVTVYETGEQEGHHYYSMDYVQGRNLAELVREQPLSAKHAVGYLEKIATAVHYAHQKGVLHRDLKPSNVIIDEQDQPHITDFGLAKRLISSSAIGNPQSEMELTLTGQLLGSPNFMPPEQASADRGHLGAASDVYGLGAILYFLLTGRPPFQAETLTVVLHQLANADPISPRQLNPSIPRDLETIALKCLEKDPRRRYQTAEELAVELMRFLAGEPIQARPVAAAEKAWRWCHRKPQMAGLSAAAVLLFLLGFAGVTWQWRRAESQQQRAKAGEYVLAMNLAQQALKANNVGRALTLLVEHQPVGKSGSRNLKSKTDHGGGFEWRYLWQQCQNEAELVFGNLQSAIRSLEVSANGQWLFAGSDGGGAKIRNLATGEEIPLAAKRGIATYGAFSPDSRYLLFSDQSPQGFGTIAVWDLQARRRLAPITDDRPLGMLAFSPDGRRFGFGVAQPPSGRLVLMDFPSRKKLREIDLRVKLVDGLKGREWVFTPDNRSVIFTETEPECSMVFCDLAAGSEPQYFSGQREGITAMAISPDGRMLATGAGYTDHDIQLWEVPSFRSLGELSGHAGWITALRFSPDGQMLASASADLTIRFWDAPARTSRRTIRGLTGEVWRLCFAPDGQKLFGGASDGTIQRWSADADQTQTSIGFWRRHVGFESLAIGPNSGQYAGIRQGQIYLGDAQQATVPIPIPDLGATNSCLLFSADGETLISGTWTGDLQVWSPGSGQAVRRIGASPDPVGWLGQDSRGRNLVAVRWKGEVARQSWSNMVEIWNTTDWRRQKPLAIPWLLTSYAVSPQGRWLATGDKAGNLQLWSLTSQPKTITVSFPGGLNGIAFSPDGKLLAAVGADGTVRAWELPGLREWASFRASSHALFALAFSPDSQRLAIAGSGDDAVTFWDVVTWQELVTWERAGESLRQIAFSNDGKQLIAGNSQGDVLVWRAPSWTEIEAKETQKKVP